MQVVQEYGRLYTDWGRLLVRLVRIAPANCSANSFSFFFLLAIILKQEMKAVFEELSCDSP